MVEYTYDSWGKLISTTGSLATTLGANQPFRYRGYVYDTETQWYYLQSRYYDPNTCRFISSDVYLSTGQGVIGHNSYAYCNNSPLKSVDSDGRMPKPYYSVGLTDTGDRGGGAAAFRGLLLAAGAEADAERQRQKQRKNLFHLVSSLFHSGYRRGTAAPTVYTTF